MSVAVRLEELLDYSDHERAKWQAWIGADPRRLAVPFHADGRFPTIGSVFDHVFLVERRHLARLEGATPPSETGVPAGDWCALFDYAGLVRADLRRYTTGLTEDRGTETLSFSVQSGGPFSMSRRKLALHIVLHEVRHFAQVAYAARVAGHEPPGTHDLFYFPEFA
jgi:uncharacterized damage-inducible protein DinB